MMMRRRGGGGEKKEAEPKEEEGEEVETRKAEFLVSSSSSPEEDNRFLDEDDQDDIIQQLQSDLEKQQDQLSLIFRLLCWSASGLGFLVVGIDEWQDNKSSLHGNGIWIMRCLRWIHCILSSYLHHKATNLVPPSSPSSSSSSPAFDTKPFPGIVHVLPDKKQDLMLIVAAPVLSLTIAYAIAIMMKRSSQGESITPRTTTIGEGGDDSNNNDFIEEGWFIHIGLFVFNIFTLGVCMLLRWDRLDAVKALNEVIKAKYHHKSL